MELGPVHHGGLQGHVLTGANKGIHHDLVHRLLALGVALDHQRAAVHVDLQRVQGGADGAGGALGHQDDHVAAVGADVGVVLMAGHGVAVHQRALFVAQLDGDVLFVCGVGAVQVFAGAHIAEQILHLGVGLQFQGAAVFTQQGDAAVGTHQNFLLVQLVVEDGLTKGGAGLIGVHRFGDGEVDGAAHTHGALQLVFMVLARVVVDLAASLLCEVRFDPAAFAVFRIVVIARQVLGDLVGEALEIHFLAGLDGDAGVVVFGHDLVKDRHALFGGEHHQLAVLVDVGELVAVEGVGGGLAVHGVDPLALLVEGILPQGAQAAQAGGDDLVGGVGDAVELGAEGHLTVRVQHQSQHQAALGEVEGVGDAVTAAVHLVVGRQGDLLDGDVRQGAGDEHGGLLVVAHGAAGPQDEQAAGDVLRGAVAALFHLVQIHRVACGVFEHRAVFGLQQGVAGGLLVFHQLRLKAAGFGAVGLEHGGRVHQQVGFAVPDHIQARSVGHQRALPVQGADLIVDAGLISAGRKVDVGLRAVQQEAGGIGGGVAACIIDVAVQHRVAGALQHLDGVGQRGVGGGAGLAGGAQIPLARRAVFAGDINDGVGLAVAAGLVLILGLAGGGVVGGQGDGDVLALHLKGEGHLAGVMLVVFVFRQHRLGSAHGLAHQGVDSDAVLVGGLQVEPAAGVTVHHVIALAVHRPGRGLAQVGPDLLAVHADAAAGGVLHVIHLADEPVLGLGGQLAGVFVPDHVVVLVQRAVGALVNLFVKAGVLHAAGVVLGGEAGGHRLHLHIGELQRVAVHGVGVDRVFLGGGFASIGVYPRPGKLGEVEHVPAVLLAVGGVGDAIHLHAALHRPLHVGHPVDAVERLAQRRRVAAEGLAGGHGVAQTRDVYQADGGAADGHGVVVVPDHLVAGAQEIGHREGVGGRVIPHLAQVGAPALLVQACLFVERRFVIGHAVAEGVGHRSAIGDVEVLPVEAVPVHLVHILGLGAAAGEGVEPQAVALLVVQQEVVVSLVGGAGDGVHGGLQAAEVIVVDVSGAQRQNDLHVHFLQGVLVGEVFAARAGHRFGGDQADAGFPAALQQALGGEPAGADGLQKHLVGGVLFHGEIAGGQVDGDAFAQLDLHHIARGVLHKLEVAHRRFGPALFDAGDIAPGVHVEQGAVGQQVAVEPLGGVVALEVVVQHVLAGEGVVGGQLHGDGGDVAQGAGHRDGDGGGAGDHGGLHAFLEVHLHVAVQRDHPLDVDRVVVALQLLVVLIHDDEGHRHDVHEHVAAGLDVHHAVRAGEHIGVECLARRAHAGRALDQQVMGPNRRHGGAGGDVGHAVHTGKGAALFSGPDELHMAVGVGHKAADLHAAGAAELGAHFGLVIGHIVDGVADAEHGGLDEAAVGNVDAVQLHVEARAVGDDDPGQHRLVVDDDAAGGVFAVVGEVRHAGQVVADVPQGDGVAVDRIVAVRLLDAHFAHGQLALVLGDVDVDAARRVAQIEGGAAVHRDGPVADEGVAGAGLLDDEAAFAGVPPDAATVKAVAGDRHGGAPQDDAAAQHGVGVGGGGAAGPGQGLARRVQLDGGAHVDVGVPVGGLGGGVDVQAVVAGDVGPGDVHVRRQSSLGVAEGVHRRAQSRALGVGVGVDVQFAVAGDDLHVPSFDDHALAGGSRDDHVGIQAGVHVGGGVGGDPQAGGVRADVGLHARLGGVGEDVHGAEAGPDEGVLADLDLHIVVDVHQGGGGAQGDHAAGGHFGAGDDAVPRAARRADHQVAVVGQQGAVIPDEDGHRPVQGVLGPQGGAAEEPAAVGVGGGVQLSRGDGLHGEGLAGVQGAVYPDGVGGVGGVFAVGDAGVHADADGGAPGLAAALGGVLAEHAHAAAGGAHHSPLQHVHAGVVPGVGGQHAHGQAAGGHVQALFDVGPGVAGVVGPQGHVPGGFDEAAFHGDAHGLGRCPGAAHLRGGGIHAGGHQAAAALAGGHSLGHGVAHRLGGEGPGGFDGDAFHQHIHLVVGGGGGVQAAQQHQPHADAGLGGGLGLGEALGPHADAARVQGARAGEGGGVGGGALGGDVVDARTHQAHVRAAGAARLGGGNAIAAGAHDLGVHVQLPADDDLAVEPGVGGLAAL